MARRFRRRGPPQFWPMVWLFSAVLLVPLGVIALTATATWDVCRLRLPLLGHIDYDNCQHLRAAIVILGAVSAFGLIAFVWDRLGLSRVFEVPWFGVGDDVENVGTLESIVRAAIFVLFLWLCVGMAALVWVGVITGFEERRSERPPPNQPQIPSPEPTPGDREASAAAIVREIRRLNIHLDNIGKQLTTHGEHLAGIGRIQQQLAGWDPKQIVPPDLIASILAQAQQLNAGVERVTEQLRKQEQRLAPLDQVQQKLAGWDPKEIPSAAAVASIYQQTQRLNGNLDAINKQLTTHERHLAAVGDIQQKLAGWDPRDAPSAAAVGSVFQQVQRLAGQLDSVNRQLSRHEQHLAFLEQIHQALTERDGEPGSGRCFDDPSSATEPAKRYRTVKVSPVFFDRGDDKLSAWAQQDLSWFLTEARNLPGMVVIHGSADPQGPAPKNEQLARTRAQAIEDYVRENSPSLPVLKRTSEPGTGEPKSEPYKRVTMIRLLLPCR